jgi:Rrf2 family protein
VDLTLSSRGDYVLRAAIDLAEHWDGGRGYRKIREVAAAMDLPLSYTPQLLGLLARAGLAEAKAGRAGGYRLTRDPSTIAVLEVIEAAEGHLSSRRCPMRGGPCHWDDVCALHPTWVSVSEAIRATLAGVTLAEIAAVNRRLARGEPVVTELPARAHRRRARRTRA